MRAFRCHWKGRSGWAPRLRRLVAALGLVLLAPASALAQSQPLSPELEQGIAALLEEKAARTPAQRKLDSQLLYTARMRRGLPVARGIARLETDVPVDDQGRVLVDVRGSVDDPLLREIRELGGSVVSSVPRFGAVRARVPLDAVETLAGHPAVRRVRRADRAFTRKLNTSQGDGAHFADDARAAFGVDGSGVTVGVLSDGVDSWQSLVPSDDLSDVTVLEVDGVPQAGSGNEGTAMLEIIHDLAPGASLVFATAFSGQAEFASNILALRDLAHADVIVDDVGYFAEAVFEDDDVAHAVDQVVADGALYFSAAGNGGNLDDGTAGVWEGDFVPGQTVNGKPAHDYGGGDVTNEVTVDSPFAFSLHWADPLGESSNDYDLFLTNKPGTVIFAASTDVQAGSGDPFEIIGSGINDKGRQLIIVRSAGSANRYLHLNANRGELEHATTGQIGGHPGARGALAVAAVDARSHTAGFTGSEPVETYSSDGPRRVFFEYGSVPITPGNFSSSGGELRDKPDLAGADCVSTASPGFSTFCGTSAAAPHAAAIAALLIELGGGPATADPADVVAALTGTTLDIEAVGADRDSGAGIAQALAAAGAMPQPECSLDADCDDGLFCNGNESCDAGSCAAGTPPACSGPTPFCDEAQGACVACLADADCDDALFCNGSELCSAGACGAGSPPACEAPTPFCDEAQDACAECLADADCDDALFCNGSELCSAGACAAGAPPACEAPTPVCDEALASCSECGVDADCGAGASCQAGVCLAPVVPTASPVFHALLTLLVAAVAALSLRRRRPAAG